MNLTLLGRPFFLADTTQCLISQSKISLVTIIFLPPFLLRIKVEKFYTKVPNYFSENMSVASRSLTISSWNVAPWKENQNCWLQKEVLFFSNPADQKTHVTHINYLSLASVNTGYWRLSFAMCNKKDDTATCQTDLKRCHQKDRRQTQGEAIWHYD